MLTKLFACYLKKILLCANYRNKCNQTRFCCSQTPSLRVYSPYTSPSLTFTLVTLPGNAFLISLLNNWITQINISDVRSGISDNGPECQVKSSFTFLWSCCFSVWRLLLQNFTIDLKSVWKSVLTPFCSLQHHQKIFLTALVNSRFMHSSNFFCEVICTGNKLFCERAQKWHFFFHTPTHTFFVRKKRRKSSEVIIEPAPYFWGSLLSLVPIYLPSTDFPGRGQAPLTSGI